MAGKIRIKVNRAGVGAILKSKKVQDDLDRRARAIAAAAGDGMEVDTRVGKTRARASVRTATPEAREAEAVDHRLLKALDAGR